MEQIISFARARPEDAPMIEAWVTRPHVREWLHGEGLENTLDSLHQSFTDLSDFQHWIAYEEGTPFGYMLTAEVDPDEEAFSSIDFAGGKVFSLDVFICETEYLGKGFGTAMIKEFLRTEFSDASDIIIDPEVRNSRAVHVYKKVGFQIVDTFIAPWHPVPHYLMHIRFEDLQW